MEEKADCRCKSTEFNANGQLFFQPLLQAMRIMMHFGETLPDSVTASYQISAGLLALWACTIFGLMLATFGIGAASGKLHFLPLFSTHPMALKPCNVPFMVVVKW